MDTLRKDRFQDETEGLARAWVRSWEQAFIRHYEDGVRTTHQDGTPYPGADAITYAVALANADVFSEALIFSGMNVEERMKRVRAHQKWMRERDRDRTVEGG